MGNFIVNSDRSDATAEDTANWAKQQQQHDQWCNNIARQLRQRKLGYKL